MRQTALLLSLLGMIGIVPAAIPTTGLQLHLDASSLVGYSNGAVVSTWPDLAGGNHNATSAGTPTFLANRLNGKPVIKIDGTSDITGADMPHSFDFYAIPTIYNVKTIAFVFKSTSNTYYSWAPIMAGPTSDDYGWHGDTWWGTPYWDHLYSINSIRNSDLAIDGIGGFNGGYTAMDYNNFHVITVQLAAGTQFNLGFLAHTARYNDFNVHGMEIAELLVYDQTLNAADLETLQFELGLKYGLWAAKPIYPVSGATMIPVNDDLSWKAYDPSWKVDVYFDPNQSNVVTGAASARIASNQVLTAIDPGTLAHGTTYYWRVDVHEPNAPGADIIVKGPVWNFTTVPPDPVITENPVSQTVPAGSPVTLSVAGQNITSYQWYLNGSLLAGKTAAILHIPSLGIADEGLYTCVASNAVGFVASKPAIVVSKRLMGWWKLDGDLNDSVAAVVPGALAHHGSISNPNFSASGKDGGAYEFTGDGRVIMIADSSDYFNFYPQGLTVSAWVNTAQTGWGGFVCKNNLTNTAGFYLEHQGDSWLVSGLRGIDGQWSAAAGIYNTWQLLTLTLDGQTKTVRQYVNGALTAEASYTIELPLSEESLFFGAEKTNGGFPYVGLLDDVRIYSYPLDAVAVARLYTDLTPGSEVCVEYSPFDVTGPNGQPDCRVTIYDFAAMAAQWLDCNLVPTCLN
ncbi:MAG TPA: immunoglobulin domain-containing protein [Anaerohalosphaeraceae bacterium]|nr:immunoglobulin domain-containing protein [Phycisphaerae bacterium]HOK95196.1 immunoglobulin domain-containing protein [Anaerohalosphaeraceae bacterium]HOL32683.1 immunoglobulin domain-containing protein [Anaerohalosphaeraceae bacterium]HPC65583.1 immunoglobulin domain-containing protein [Anaerohalosphaeraceae bacterium]HPO71008.1 immunoglobulin domain-containing protein [Anaerohalosphaeraceae bacterium]